MSGVKEELTKFAPLIESGQVQVLIVFDLNSVPEIQIEPNAYYDYRDARYAFSWALTRGFLDLRLHRPGSGYRVNAVITRGL